jgi:acetyl-CoA C-acetyltransferase
MQQTLLRLFARNASVGSTRTVHTYLVDGVRTPIGSFRGQLSTLRAPQLGSTVVEALLRRTSLPASQVNEVIFGNVCQAGVGQAPTRQVALNAGLPVSTVTTTVNKVCASGMKAIMWASQHTQLNPDEIVIAGGMESMSNVPFYLSRGQPSYGGAPLLDGILLDGLTNSFEPRFHMGNCGENTAAQLQIGREEQDNFAKLSYERALKAIETKAFADEIVPVTIAGKHGRPDVIVCEDEEVKRVDFGKFAKLKPAFQKSGGTITAANASKLNDGSAACLIMSDVALQRTGLSPLAQIVAFADGACDPIDFPIAPIHAIRKALNLAKLQQSQIAQWEINEAFSVVVLANRKLLNLDLDTINVNGGAVSLGHPIGMSGARIVITLAKTLKSGQYGLASICNGGGGASAVILRKM